jgi:hypothetical protein
MSPLPALATYLTNLPSLAELFRLFLSGKHLNRLAEPTLWAELEQQEADYVGLFAALGYELRLDARGFAWFHHAEANSSISKTSRQLALLFMVIFDTQANAGKTLQRFTDWLIDSEWLNEMHKQQQEVLDAEGISPEVLVELINRAGSLGFASAEPAGWRLLPAVHRYLDHFVALAENGQVEHDPAENMPYTTPETDDPDAEEGQ